MKRQIIHIDENKCTGCGLCVSACHEGALDLIDGKARLVRENFCDGFGDCLPACPAGAITFEEREAPAYDEAAVKKSRETKKEKVEMKDMRREGGCPGSRVVQLKPTAAAPSAEGPAPMAFARPVSRLGQWPCQIKLVPVTAPFFKGAKLLVANMHEDFMKGKVTLIGCPKLDAVDYTDKLTAILRENDIQSLTIVRMEVPCCGGLQRAAVNALKESGRFIPWQVVTISRDGKILD